MARDQFAENFAQGAQIGLAASAKRRSEELQKVQEARLAKMASSSLATDELQRERLRLDIANFQDEKQYNKGLRELQSIGGTFAAAPSMKAFTDAEATGLSGIMSPEVAKQVAIPDEKKYDPTTPQGITNWVLDARSAVQGQVTRIQDLTEDITGISKALARTQASGGDTSQLQKDLNRLQQQKTLIESSIPDMDAALKGGFQQYLTTATTKPNEVKYGVTTDKLTGKTIPTATGFTNPQDAIAFANTINTTQGGTTTGAGGGFTGGNTNSASTSTPTDVKVTVISPSGQKGVIPQSQLKEALSKGYKQAN